MFYSKSREFPGFLGSMVSGLPVVLRLQPPSSPKLSPRLQSPLRQVIPFLHPFGISFCSRAAWDQMDATSCRFCRFPAEFLVDSSCRSRGNKNEKIEQSSKPRCPPFVFIGSNGLCYSPRYWLVLSPASTNRGFEHSSIVTANPGNFAPSAAFTLKNLAALFGFQGFAQEPLTHARIILKRERDLFTCPWFST